MFWLKKKIKLPYVDIGSVKYTYPLESRDNIIDYLIDQERLFNNSSDIRKLQLCLRTGGCIVDAGCHIGSKTLYLAEYKRYRFISIDACPESINCLKESVRENDLDDYVRPVQAVLSHSNFLCSFDQQTNERSIIEKPISFWKSLFSKNTKRYKTKTLDKIIGDTRCGVIKVDVGGYELSILHGAIETIKRDSPNLLINFDGRNASIDSILDLLDELEYEAFFLTDQIDPTNSLPIIYKVDKACDNCQPTFMMCFHKDVQKHGLSLGQLEGAMI
tara:strand:- start:810 stop:1631 length:822 start_codon:yes stop_codon:yes gene_type:complete